MMDLQRRKNKKLMKDMAMDTSDWARLPNNIVDLVLDKLVSLGDYIRFGAVCVDWNTVAVEYLNHRNRRRTTTNDDYCSRTSSSSRFWHHQLPMLMIPPPARYFHDKNISCFYSVTHEEVLSFDSLVPYHKRFIGSSFGWLISVDKDFIFTLFNPFSNTPCNNNVSTIRLLEPFTGPEVFNQVGNFDFGRLGEVVVFNHEYFFLKAILSAEPTLHRDNYILMLIYGSSRRLGFIQPGYGNWICPEDPKNDHLRGFCDVIYSSNGFFNALQDSGAVICFEIDLRRECEGTQIYMTPILRTETHCPLRYLVESCSGDLLQVLRFEKLNKFTDENFSAEFKIFKYQNRRNCCPKPSDSESELRSGWVELNSLGDDVLFLGDNASLSVLASDFPGGALRPGSIYFSFGFRPELLVLQQPYHRKGRLDMAVVNLETKSVEALNIHQDAYWYSAMLNRPPIWVVPTFQDAPVKKKRQIRR